MANELESKDEKYSLESNGLKQDIKNSQQQWYAKLI